MARVLTLVAGALIALALAASALAEKGTQSWLKAVTGTGTGRVLISPTSQEHGEFYAQGEVEVEGVPPETTMTVMRAIFTDATCNTIVLPWAPVAPGSFTT